MSEDKDDLKSIKVYWFNNTKESWHEFALKFGVIADSRGYSDIIEGVVTAPDEKENLEILNEDNAATKKSKKEKQLARAANKKGFRDLVMSTDGISLNIVQNAVSDKLTRGDLKKAWGRLERRWNPKTREDKVQFYTKFLHNKLENVKQRPMDWLAFMEKKRNELANTGHIMDDETFITHLLNSLRQAEYEGVIQVIKERLRVGTCDLTQVEQLLEDKYLSMKFVKGWEEEEDDYALFASPAKKKGQKKQFKGRCGYCGEIGHKSANCPDKKSKKKEDSQDKSDKQETQKPKKDGKGKGKTDMTKIKCYNCREMGHFAQNCSKPRENANIAQESEQNRNFGILMDFGDSSVCKECAMICTDVYSDEEYERMIVYGDQGISTKTYEEETYRDLLKSDSDEEPIVKYNVALCAKDSVSMEKKRRRLNRNTPSETKSQLSLNSRAIEAVPRPTSNDDVDESQKAWTMGMPTNDGNISTINTAELTQIEDRNKQFLYARAIHANHMIQYHMNEILERQRVVDEYRLMADEGRELIHLESELHRSDPVVIQHTMQMIDTDIHWHEQTFRDIIKELRKLRNGETPTKPNEETSETAMMCWESLDESKHASKKHKTHTQDNETSGNANEMDDKTPTMPTHTTTMSKHLNEPVGELRLGADDDPSTLATQENPSKKLVYIMNMPECTLESSENVRESSKNTNEEDDRKPSPVEKTDQITSNIQLNNYEESDREEDSKKVREAKKNIWRTRKIIHTEFDLDDDVDEQMKNSSNVKTEGKVRVKKKL